MVSGDWHLGLSIGGYDFFDDTVCAVRTMIDAADEVDMVVMLGDLFHDGRPHPRLVAAAMELIDEFPCPGIFLTGNHDIGRGFYTTIDEKKNRGAPEILPLPDALEPFRKVRFRKEHLFPDRPCLLALEDSLFLCAGYITDAIAKKLHGWNSAQEMIDSVFVEASASEERVKAAFCHLDVEGASLGSEAAVLRGAKLAIPKGLANNLNCEVFNGHLHKRQTMKNIIMPGSIIQTDFGEVDGKQVFAIVEV
jgi:DNA repair exonuclease SbcCD nuclease subunit